MGVCVREIEQEVFSALSTPPTANQLYRRCTMRQHEDIFVRSFFAVSAMKYV